MIVQRHQILLPSLLAACALQCGGGSTPPSNTPEPAPSVVGNAANASDEAPENSGAQSTMNLNDPQILQVTSGVHDSEINQARLAQQKTENPEVRQFAAMMIEQHEQARQRESGLSLGGEESPLSRRLHSQSEAKLEELRAKQGAEFDRAYIHAQIEAHQQVLETIRNELRPNAQDPRLQVHLQQLEPQVAQHLDHARRAEQSLESATSSEGTQSSARSD